MTIIKPLRHNSIVMEFKYTYTRLNVKDFQKCKDFYKNTLGLSVTFEDENDEYVEFSTGGIKLTIYPQEKLHNFIEQKDNVTKKESVADIVISFCVHSMADAVKELESKGVEILSNVTQFSDRGFKSTYFKDPDGNIVEIEEMTDVVI